MSPRVISHITRLSQMINYRLLSAAQWGNWTGYALLVMLIRVTLQAHHGERPERGFVANPKTLHMDEAEECAKQSLRTGPVRKEQTSRVHSKRALVNFSTNTNSRARYYSRHHRHLGWGRERPRHMISNPNKTLAFRASVPSMHQGIFA